MIDASKGFFKDANKNRLRERDIHKIVDIFTRQVEIPKYSRMVPLSEISNEKNNYNLNIPRYIDSQECEDLQDIDAHLKGDVPIKDIDDLAPYWKALPSIRQVLFSPSKRAGYSVLNVDQSEIKSLILDHSEFKTYSQLVEKLFLNWKAKSRPLLNGINVGTKPRELILTISESLLEVFAKLELIDKYDIYQHLMTYWEETMQDDAYLIALDGWKAEITILKNEKEKEVGWDCDLIPKTLVINKYFAKQRDALENLRTQLDAINQQMQTWDEENEGEDDMFSEARSEAGKITKRAITNRIHAIKDDREFADELQELTEYQDYMDRAADLKTQVKEAEVALDKQLLIRYRILTEDEIRTLVVEDKWMTSLENSVRSEMGRISQRLAQRTKELADRYQTPLPMLTEAVQTLTKVVDDHLEKMGFKWQ
jgi:type I restriction enzyme M protein